MDKTTKRPQPGPTLWWFGGVASMFGAMCTHPLDTLKIRLQTTISGSTASKPSLYQTTASIIRNEGISALYSGLSASLLRQATYSTARFAVYDSFKSLLEADNKRGKLPFYKQLLAAISGGIVGGFIGSPADLTNVRMQDDGRRPPHERRNYKHAFDGLYRIVKEEGALNLFRGVGPNVQRAMIMTASQLATYDLFKQEMLCSGIFQDNIITHFGASLLAGLVATTVCSPIDVMKTRIMAAKGSPYKGTGDAFVKILKSEGLPAFFKGWLPSFTRLGPHTILTFLAYERLRIVYGIWLDRRYQL